MRRQDSQTSPLVGMADDGTFIVKWSEGTNSYARWISWDATNQTQILGPRIQSIWPADSASAPITNVMVTFDRLMNATAFRGGCETFRPIGSGSCSNFGSNHERSNVYARVSSTTTGGPLPDKNLPSHRGHEWRPHG